MTQRTWILGVETSCDETGVALYNGHLVHHRLSSQWALHAPYGGVVPEVAARAHAQHLAPMLQDLIQATGIPYHALAGIAYTQGPGLQGCLLTGAAFAKGLGWSLGIPTLGVHHMEGHLYAAFLDDPPPQYPYLALLVSGGHTQLVWSTALGHYQILGQTRDDAAGEAFDKAGKMMGLPYPGGPHLAQQAQQGNPQRFALKRPMCNQPTLDMSFSGLKTAFRRWVDAYPHAQHDLAASFQAAVVDTLCHKVRQALICYPAASLVVSGGVAANTCLREAITQLAQQHGIPAHIPPRAWCTDNGAMIAGVGWKRFQYGERDPSPHHIEVRARWSLETLNGGRVRGEKRPAVNPSLEA